jgi:hypothetical protein
MGIPNADELELIDLIHALAQKLRRLKVVNTLDGSIFELALDTILVRVLARATIRDVKLLGADPLSN